MEVSIVAAIAVAVANMVIGFIWYSKFLFADVWMKETGLSMEQVSKGPGMGYLITTVVSFVTGLVLSFLVHRMGTTEAVDGLALGALLWVGLILPAYTATYTFSMKSMKLLLIDSGYFLAVLAVAGVLVTLIR